MVDLLAHTELLVQLRHSVPPVGTYRELWGLVVIWLSWLSGRALAAQARGLLGSTPGGCWPFSLSSNYGLITSKFIYSWLESDNKRFEQTHKVGIYQVHVASWLHSWGSRLSEDYVMTSHVQLHKYTTKTNYIHVTFSHIMVLAKCIYCLCLPVQT